MRSSYSKLFAVAICLSAWACSLSAYGQAPWSYSPRRPTLSPYFGFFQVNTTPLPNYQALVVPRQEIRSTFQRDEFRIDRLERQIQLRDTGTNRGLLRYAPDEVGAPARAATFMNLEGFYPTRQVPSRR